MPIKFNCHKCGANLRVPEQHIGKKARCPKCDEKCIVPEVSQRGSAAPVSGNFEDVGNLLEPLAADPPMGMPPAAAVPLAAPAPAMPLPAPAQPAALPSSIPPVSASPYASPIKQKRRSGGGSISGSVVQPLYEARTFIKIFGWAMFIVGIIQLVVGFLQIIVFMFGAMASARGGPNSGAIAFSLIFGTIIGFIVPFITTWIGWQVKTAGSNLTAGVETGDKELVRMACQRLANFFRIMGILGMIGLGIMAILLFLAISAFIVAFAASA